MSSLKFITTKHIAQDINQEQLKDLIKSGNIVRDLEELLFYAIKSNNPVNVSTVFEKAIESNLDEVLDYLLTNVGIPTDIMNNGIELTIRNENLILLKKLHKNGGKITKEKHMNTAVEIGNHQILEYLLQYGGRIDNNTLHTAIWYGDLDMVKYHYNHGIDLDDKALELAELNNQEDIEKYIKNTFFNCMKV